MGCITSNLSWFDFKVHSTQIDISFQNNVVKQQLTKTFNTKYFQQGTKGR